MEIFEFLYALVRLFFAIFEVIGPAFDVFGSPDRSPSPSAERPGPNAESFDKRLGSWQEWAVFCVA